MTRPAAGHLRAVDTEGSDQAQVAPARRAPLLAKAPPCPAHLVGHARREWQRAAKDMTEAGLLTDLDLGTLTAYCVAYGNHREATVILRAEAKKHPEGKGLYLKSKAGGYYPHPALSVQTGAAKDMVTFAKALGLTPWSRRNIDNAGKGGSGKTTGNAVAKKYGI